MGDASDEDNGPADDINNYVPNAGFRWLIETQEEWFYYRLELYEELQAYGVDEYLIGAVTAGANRVPVTWVDEARKPAEFGKHAGLVVDQLSVDNTLGSFIKSLSRRWRLEGRDVVPPNVGEALAWELRRRLRDRKQKRNANKREGDKKGPAPVRSRDSNVPEIGLFSKIAADLLDECRFSGYPPGPQLSALIQELLGADRPRLKDTENYSARDKAAWIYAHKPDATYHQVGGAVGVAHTTVRRWYNDRQFQTRVERRRNLILTLKADRATQAHE